jgi:histone H3/H4
MQATLNRMVTSVRHGILGPDDASRSIHECAALLGLQLATEIPVVTLIITGMRKTVDAEDIVDAFSEFGEIADAAVSPNQRGFGKYPNCHILD